MEPFRTSSAEYSSSIVVDASTVNNTTVTVAVYASREDEIEILDRLYKCGEAIDFKPFYHKSRDFAPDEHADFYENVVKSNLDHLSALSHHHRGTPNTQQVEAVHSALLVQGLCGVDTDTLVLLDGGENTAQFFVQTIGELRRNPPPVVHCQQSERYYPTALLADLAARWIAEKIENSEYNYQDPLLRAPRGDRCDNWGKAYSGLYDSPHTYTPEEIPQRWGGSTRERIRCWFDGAVAADAGAAPPATDSVTPIVRRLREEGYEYVATRLLEV